MGSVLERLEDLIRNSEEITSKFTDFKDNDFPNEVEAEKTKAIKDFREAIHGLYAARGGNAPYAWQDRLIAKIVWSDHEQNYIMDDNQRGTVLGDLMILMGSEFPQFEDDAQDAPDYPDAPDEKKEVYPSVSTRELDKSVGIETNTDTTNGVRDKISSFSMYAEDDEEVEEEGVGLPDPAYLIPGSR